MQKLIHEAENRVKKIILSRQLKFLIYNLFLPLIIPGIFLIGTKMATEEITFREIFSLDNLKVLLQSVSLYLVVTFFTNIGFWASDKMQENESAKNKESSVAISLILGVLSVFIFVCSFIAKKISLVYSLILISVIFLISAVWMYYHNPLIMHSSASVDREKGDETTTNLISNITKDENVN